MLKLNAAQKPFPHADIREIILLCSYDKEDLAGCNKGMFRCSYLDRVNLQRNGAFCPVPHVSPDHRKEILLAYLAVIHLVS